MAAAPVQPVQYVAAGAPQPQPQVIFVQQQPTTVYVQGTVRMGGLGRALVSLTALRIGQLGRTARARGRVEIAGSVC